MLLPLESKEIQQRIKMSQRIEKIAGPFRLAWRGSGSSGFFVLSRVLGSTNEKEMIAPRTS